MVQDRVVGDESAQVVVGTSAAHDPARLAAVTATGLLDTGSEAGFDRLATLVQTLLEVPFAFVTVVDDERSFWKAARGIPEGGPTQNTLEESFCRYVVDSGRPLVLPDVRRDPRTRDNPSIRSMGVVAWAGFPVRTPDGHVMGTLCAVDTEVHAWSERDVEVLASLAEIASREVALRQYAVAADAARSRAQLLARIGELLPVGLDSAAIWSALARLVVPVVGDLALVYSVEADGQLVTRALAHGDPVRQRELEGASLLRRRMGQAHGPGRVAETRRSEVVPDLTVLSGLSPEQTGLRDLLGAGSSITVPLTARGRLIGVLSTIRARGQAPYSDDDLELVEAVADRAALVLDSALSYDQQRSLSLQLQQALLPTSLPQPDQLAVAYRYQPAGNAQVVGGDWYDALVDGAGAARLVIGDVAGHDIHAATVMGQLRTMLRMAGHDGSRSPAATLRAVDDATGSMGQPVFATALLAEVDPPEPGRSDRRLTWSSAGHLPPLLLTADGRTRLLETRPEPALGLDLAAAGMPTRREDHTAELPAGATLLLYTDGLVERRGEDLDAGLERLLGTVTGLAAAGLELEALCDAVLDQLGDRADDDIALVAVRVLPDGPPPAAGDGSRG